MSELPLKKTDVGVFVGEDGGEVCVCVCEEKGQALLVYYDNRGRSLTSSPPCDTVKDSEDDDGSVNATVVDGSADDCVVGSAVESEGVNGLG